MNQFLRVFEVTHNVASNMQHAINIEIKPVKFRAVAFSSEAKLTTNF